MTILLKSSRLLLRRPETGDLPNLERIFCTADMMRGLASALIARSLQVLKEQGVTEAELGVDAENESAAFRLYESLGYKTFSVDTWFRKDMKSLHK